MLCLTTIGLPTSVCSWVSTVLENLCRTRNSSTVLIKPDLSLKKKKTRLSCYILKLNYYTIVLALYMLSPTIQWNPSIAEWIPSWNCQKCPSWPGVLIQGEEAILCTTHLYTAGIPNRVPIKQQGRILSTSRYLQREFLSAYFMQWRVYLYIPV